MIHRTVLVLIFVVGIAAATAAEVFAADAGTGYGQITLVNQTSQIVDLYVDDHHGCRALAGLTCSTMERAGGHTLVAKGADGQETSLPMVLDDGGTFTYTISES